MKTIFLKDLAIGSNFKQSLVLGFDTIFELIEIKVNYATFKNTVTGAIEKHSKFLNVYPV